MVNGSPGVFSFSRYGMFFNFLPFQAESSQREEKAYEQGEERRLRFTRGVSGGKLTLVFCEPTMCTHSPEGQLYPGLHQEKRGQQVEGGDSAPLLHSGETPPGVLCPALEPSAQEGHGAVGAASEEGNKNGQRTEAPLL